MRFPGCAICLAAIATIVVLAYADAPDRSLATSPPSAQRFSVDLDPYFTTPNTATSLGSSEPCARIQEDGFLNFDEDFVDTLEFDVTVTGIPVSNAMTGYAYSLAFPQSSTSIVYHQPMKLGSPIIIVDNSDPVPDTDGMFNVSVLDPSGTGVSGSGVLDRLRIQTNPAPVAGLFALAVSNAVHIDTNNITWAPDAVDSGILAVNTAPCPLFVDIEMVSLSLASANPVSIGVDTTVTADESIRNNSPYAANTVAQTTFTVPSGCTLNGVTGTVTLNAPLGVLPGIATVPHQETPVLRCTTLGAHQMPVTACGVIADPNYLEIQTSNNCQTQNLNFDVVAPPGTDADGDGVRDLDEFNCGVPTLGVSLRPEIINGFDDDGDGQPDEALPAGSEGSDCDGDGYSGATEAHVFGASGRDQQDCGTSNWPADIVDGGSLNRVTLADIGSFVAPVRHFNTNPGDTNYAVRWDLVEGGTPYAINLSDLASLVVVKPAKFGGTRAFNALLTCGPVGCSEAIWCTKPGSPAGVELRLETDRLIYHPGEPVHISLIATNTGEGAVTLVFSNVNCKVEITVAGYYAPTLCIPGCVLGCSDSLPPTGSVTYSTTWAQVDQFGFPATRGNYQVSAWLAEDSCGPNYDPSCRVPTPLQAFHYIRLVP